MGRFDLAACSSRTETEDVLRHICVQIAELRSKGHRDRNHSISKGEKGLVTADGGFGEKKKKITELRIGF